MANDSTYRVAGTNVPGCKLLYAQILPNAALTPTIGENYGKIVSSVTWSATGLLLVTLNDTYLAAGAFTSLQLATPADTAVSIKTFLPTTTKVLTLSIFTAGVAADIAASAGNIIHLFIVCRDSTAQ